MISELALKQWDAIVVGTGIGGGTVGRRLAEQGMSVLFLERGPRGPRGEQQPLDGEIRDPVARRVRGYWPTPVPADVDGQRLELLSTLGAGVGGTSVFYAASLERPERHDLEDSAEIPHPTGGWPVGYDAFARYFAEAEDSYFVSGEPDPLSGEPMPELRPPPEMSAGDTSLRGAFEQAGLHPYRIHMGIKNLPGCMECAGHKCPRACKMDGRSAGVEPAIATGRAALIDRCQVTSLQGNNTQITHLIAERDGETLTFTAKHFILAAGALGSPALLLASTNEDWPNGCANESGLVGRNLMFHLNEMIAIWPRVPSKFGGPSKTLSMRDFYYRNARRFGIVQSLGVSASYGNIVQYLNERFDRSILKGLRPLREFTRLPALAAEKVFGQARIFVGILEDLPYESNRVTLKGVGQDRLAIEYAFSSELLSRRKLFRSAIKKSLRRLRSYFVTNQPELNFGHPCGTVRFGTDPRKSVLDPFCRSHSLNNLFVVDSSFMPTSTGVNPSLTIAANALRVADHIAEEFSAV